MKEVFTRARGAVRAGAVRKYKHAGRAKLPHSRWQGNTIALAVLASLGSIGAAQAQGYYCGPPSTWRPNFSVSNSNRGEPGYFYETGMTPPVWGIDTTEIARLRIIGCDIGYYPEGMFTPLPVGDSGATTQNIDVFIDLRDVRNDGSQVAGRMLDLDLTQRVTSNQGVNSIQIHGGDIQNIYTPRGMDATTLTLNGTHMRGALVVNGYGADRIFVNDAVIDGGIDASKGRGEKTIALDSGAVASVTGGMGNDTVIVSDRFDMSSLSRLDGHIGTDTLKFSGTRALFKEAGTHRIHVEGAAGVATEVVNFEHLWIEGGVRFTIANEQASYAAINELTVSSGSEFNLFDSAPLLIADDVTVAGGVDGSTSRLHMMNSALEVGGTVMFGQGSEFRLTGGNRVAASLFNNAGTIDFGQQSPGDVLVIEGDYHGDNGHILMNAQLGGDDSLTDQLIVTGNASGKTVVHIQPAAGSDGAKTDQGIRIVQVDGEVYDNAFVLNAPLETENGLYQYTLGRHGNAFVLNSNELLAPRVPVYSMSTTAAQSLALSNIGSMRDRGGAYEASARTSVHDLTKSMDGRYWARVRYDRVDVSRGQFSLDQKEFYFQAGWDIQEKYSDKDDGTFLRRGLTVAYGTATGDIKDHQRPEFENFNEILFATVGDIDTKSYSIGTYQTHFWSNGYYLDLVGQLSYLENEFEDIENHRAKTDGWNAYLSAELGQTIPFGKRDWRIEPQAQLTLARTSMNSFDDGQVYVGSVAQNLARARVGAWIFNNFQTKSGNNTMFYTLFNIWHDVNTPTRTKLSSAEDSIRLSPELVRTWAEVGVGFQQVLSNDRVTLFGDVRGQHAISNGDRDGIGVRFGVKVNW